MMKSFKGLMITLCLCGILFAAMNVSAESDYVYDQADLLTTEEEASLQEYAENFAKNWNMNFLVVTTDNAEGKNSMEYADDFYDERFPEESEEDGMIYLIDMDNREIYLSTCGMAVRYLTDSRIDSILDEAFNYVADGDYYGTFVAFFDETDYYLNQGIPSDQYNYDTDTGETDYYYDSYEEPMRITLMEAVIALVAALAAAGGTIGFITAKYQLKFEDFHYDAYTDSDVQLSVKSDHLVNKFVTHRRIPKNNGSSGGSRSGGGSRSSTHRSSSGRSHGGGGRRF